MFTGWFCRGLGNPLSRKGKIHHNDLFFEMILNLMEESTMIVGFSGGGSWSKNYRAAQSTIIGMV